MKKRIKRILLENPVFDQLDALKLENCSRRATKFAGEVANSLKNAKIVS